MYLVVSRQCLVDTIQIASILDWEMVMFCILIIWNLEGTWVQFVTYVLLVAAAFTKCHLATTSVGWRGFLNFIQFFDEFLIIKVVLISLRFSFDTFNQPTSFAKVERLPADSVMLFMPTRITRTKLTRVECTNRDKLTNFVIQSLWKEDGWDLYFNNFNNSVFGGQSLLWGDLTIDEAVRMEIARKVI